MRIAVLVKQVPKFEEMELGPDGRLRRDGIEPEMNPYCRRAVSKAVELAAERAGSRVVVFTLGPPAADDTLREAIAWGLERDVDIEAVHVTDAAFAGSGRLTEPSKVDPPGRAAVPADRIRRLSAADLGPGPWGVDASPTAVGPVKVMEVTRARHTRADAPLDEQVRDAARRLIERNA